MIIRVDLSVKHCDDFCPKFRKGEHMSECGIDGVKCEWSTDRFGKYYIKSLPCDIRQCPIEVKE